jgi:hypothetical protein
MTNADMKVEIIKDPACGCLGCEAERKTKALIEQSFRSFGPEIERIQALEYRDERAIKRVRKAIAARAEEIAQTMSSFLRGCSRIMITSRLRTPVRPRASRNT